MNDPLQVDQIQELNMVWAIKWYESNLKVDGEITSKWNVQSVDPFNGYKFVYETYKIELIKRRRF